MLAAFTRGLSFNEDGAVPGFGVGAGVELRDATISQWSRARISSNGVGPPIGWHGSPRADKSSAVLRSQICTTPFECPVKRTRRGRDPMRLDPSHS